MDRFAAPVFWTIVGGAGGLFVGGLLALFFILIAAGVLGGLSGKKSG